MPFLSLGLLKDECEVVVREDGAAEANVSSSSPDGSPANHPASISKGADNGTAEKLDRRAACPTAGGDLPSFQTVAQGKLRSSVSSGDDGVSDKSVRPTQDEATSHLPPAIEELRQRVSGNELPEAFV